jgi:hypothetical protein
MKHIWRIFGSMAIGLAGLIGSGMIYRPISAEASDRPRYAFAIDLDYPAHRLTAMQQIAVPNTFGDSVNEIVFNVPAAHTPGAFTLHSIQLDNQLLEHTLDQTILTVTLPTTLRPGEIVTLTLRFTVRVPELNEPQSFADANLAYASDVMSIGYWYPLLAPYRSGMGWIAAPWNPIGDPFVSEAADYTAIVTTTPGVTLVGGGEMSDANDVWHFDLPRARTFGLIASPYYESTFVRLGNVTYELYTLPRHTSLAPVALGTLVKAQRLFTALYGPYPYRTLRVAEFSGPWSMEFSGYVVLGSTEFDDYEGTARNRLVRITAHEVSHQWWYNVVGDNQIEEPWLDEGFARFNELRFYEVFSPQDVDWWWSTVIGTQRPAKPLNSPVTAFSENGSYLNSVYNQGARFLDALRQRIGRIAFDAFLRRWYQRGSFQLITTQDFFDTLKPYTTPAVLSLKRLYFR